MEVVSNITSIVLVNTVLPSLDAWVVPPVYGKGLGFRVKDVGVGRQTHPSRVQCESRVDESP